jgi:hypothetical protein
METQPEKPNYVLLVGGLVIGSVVGTLAVRSLWKPATMDETLARTAIELNKRTPMMADKEMRLDKATTAPNKTLVYHYTLVNLRAADVPKDAFAKVMRTQIIANYKTSPEMKTLRDNGVTLEYQYSDKAGAPVAAFAVSPKDF